MLILARKTDEKIIINDTIVITVVETNNRRVRLGITAPDDVSIDREEIYISKKESKKR